MPFLTISLSRITPSEEELCRLEPGPGADKETTALLSTCSANPTTKLRKPSVTCLSALIVFLNCLTSPLIDSTANPGALSFITSCIEFTISLGTGASD